MGKNNRADIGNEAAPNPKTQVQDLGQIVSTIAPIASAAVDAMNSNMDDDAVLEMVLQALLRIGYLADCGNKIAGEIPPRGEAVAWFGPNAASLSETA
jgi:hypothetical protein